ncbi:MAG: DUF1697 domain-containing protein [Bacteroidota bacterium]
MENYIALLRGINVSGQKKIRMEDLRKSLSRLGLERVRTYIQSGNVVFQGRFGNEMDAEVQIKKAIMVDFGFDVPVLVTTVIGLREILEKNPFYGEVDSKQLYFVLLKNAPNDVQTDKFNQLKFENEEFQVTAKCVYLNCGAGYGKAKLNNNLVEAKLKVEATTRNLKTLEKLIEMGTN